MKTIDSGYGNSGDLVHAQEQAFKGNLRYVTITKSGGHPGAIGGSYNYEIRGTNDMRELLKPSVMREVDEIYDTKEGKEIEKSKLASKYVRLLGKAEKEALLDEMLEKFLTGSLT